MEFNFLTIQNFWPYLLAPATKAKMSSSYPKKALSKYQAKNLPKTSFQELVSQKTLVKRPPAGFWLFLNWLKDCF